jgi:hypothetical protein
MDMPRQTAEIFAWLSRGQLISANSSDAAQAAWYGVIRQEEATFREYLSHLGFQLDGGPGYYFLARHESRSSLEDKLDRMARLIERVSWLKHLDAGIGSGHLLNVRSLQEATQARPDLRRRLRSIPAKGSPSDDGERILALMRSLERESFAEQIQEQPPTFRLLAAFHYLEALILRIQPRS